MIKKEFVYPSSDLDRSKNMLSVLGTFWANTFAGRDQLASYATATALTVAQTHRNILELVAACSRYDVPVFHRELWTPIVLRRSQVNNTDGSIAVFDATSATFNGKLMFDAPEAAQRFSFPVVEKLNGVRQFFNKLTYPTVALQQNIDFYIDDARNVVVFSENPFDNPAIPRRAVADPATKVEDEEIVLFGFCGDYDYDYIFNQFAYAVDLKMKSSQGYKDLMNVVFDSFTAGGMSAKNLDLGLAAICGIPVVLDPQETVEVVTEDGHGVFIATDRHVYRYSADAAPLVSVGQRVFAGQALVDGFEVVEFRPTKYLSDNGDDLPTYRQTLNDFLATNGLEYLSTEAEEEILLNTEDLCPIRKKPLAALALDSGFVSSCFYGDLVFENKGVPLRVDTHHPSEYTYVDFELNGLPTDIRRFFDEVHIRGIEAHESVEPCDRSAKKVGTLAHVLDRRKYAETEPKAADLPQLINPLQFLIENILRNNVFVVRITVSALGQNHLALYNIRQLRQLLPPQTAMIVVFEVKVTDDDASGADNVIEYVENFTGMEPVSDSLSEQNVVDLGATLSVVSGTCH